MSYIKKRIKAFEYAMSGIINASKGEGPFIIHWLSVVIVTILGLYFNITRTEWCIIIVCCGSVIATELLNTSIEKLCDAVRPEIDPKIKFVKDAAAGAVLIVSITDVIVGSIIFIPYFKVLFS